MRFFTVPLLVAALGVTGTLQPSNTTFKQAASSCSSALAGVTFALGHVRVSDSPGVQSTVGAMDANGNQKITLKDTNDGKTTTAIANPHKNTVQAKNLTVTRAKSVACISAD